MTTIARFSTTHIDGKPGETDLFLGVMFKGKGKALMPDHVYEIRNILDELIIVDMGACADPTAWNHDISTVLDCREQVFCTRQEVTS